MSQLQRALKMLGGLALTIGLPAVALGQVTNYYGTQAGEYLLPAGGLPGDQSYPSVAISTNGGFVVWQDNNTDGDGMGISALQLDSNLSPYGAKFQVNQNTANDQENAKVALLNNGGAVFVWQGDVEGFQHIYGRILTKTNNSLVFGSEFTVNTATNYQTDPTVTVLANGNILVTWSSYGQDSTDGLSGVYGQIFSSTGSKVGTEFAINQFTPGKQGSSAVATFPNGNFIVTWVSELQNSGVGVNNVSGAVSGTYLSVDIYARVYNSSGAAQTPEFQVNTSTNVCANPSVSTAADGGYLIGWSESFAATSWDIVARNFTSTGNGGTPYVVNSQRYNDQYSPQITSVGNDYMIVWTSRAQDGSQEGVYSQFVRNDGVFEGYETLVNTTTAGAQQYPALASDGAKRFLVTWAGFNGLATGVDIYGQRFTATLAPLYAPATPITFPLNSYSISVSWQPQAGFSVANYELFVDSSSTPILIPTNIWCNYPDSYFSPLSTHTFQLAYVLTDGRVSPLSGTATNKTYAPDVNNDFLPDDWEAKYWGTNKLNWPNGLSLLAPGVTVLDVFNWGGNPTNSSTWLKQYTTHNKQGWVLNWNTIPGGLYQVVSSPGISGPWTNYGAPRFAHTTNDSINLTGPTQAFYKISRIYFAN